MQTLIWIKGQPATAGTYLVASSESREVAQARYMPRREVWKFPSAKQAFHVTHYADMPKAPRE